ncbi:uncharacterized protein LOC131680298 [Topomyia yanbarensis]|uniref:uncharacterized protein LOC131680298 n=1 Tax=Topomyia yanbarensis TaxID=2498891 RepID=UPI00273A836C|nr:uncharacterized protein LOC131680298 [Topomyia yanbarensis]
MAICDDKFSEIRQMLKNSDEEAIKNQSLARLLHIGKRVSVILTNSRGSPNLHSNLQNVLVDLVEMVEGLQNKSDALVPGTAGTDENNGVVIPSNPYDTVSDSDGQNDEPVPRPRRSFLSMEDLEWIHSLQARIFDLEAELKKIKEGKNYSVPYHHRHTLPVSKWNIGKYSGDDQGLKLNEFLELVQALSHAEQISERELFESAIHLFTGSALKWYMTQRSTNRLLNWQHLVFELRRTYMHPDLDALIKMKIYQRRQQKHESFHEFYFEMEKLFRSMSQQIPDYEKIQILQQNMRVDYKRQLAFIPIVDLQTLVASGQKLDSLNFSAYNKVFGTEKTVNTVEVQEKKRKKEKNNQLQSQPQVSDGTTAAVSQHHNQNRNNNTQSYTQDSSNRSGPSSAQNNQRFSNSHPPSGPSHTSNQPQAGPSATSVRPQLTLEESSWQSPPPFWDPAASKLYERSVDVCQIVYPFPNDNRPYAPVKVYGMAIRALLDSGSNHTLVSEKFFSQLKTKRLNRPSRNVALRSASGDPLEIKGQAQLPFLFQGRIRIVPTLVVANLSIPCICGMDFWRKFQIQPTMPSLENGNVTQIDQSQPDSTLTEEERLKVERIKSMFLAAGDGELTLTTGAQHRIVLKEEWRDKPPVRQFPYVMSPKTQGLVAIELQRLLDKGILERSNSSWSLNCVPVSKPNKVRLCLDARKINERTVRDAYPLPHPGRILGQLPKAKYLSTIDLSEAFLQVPLEASSRKYTAFSSSNVSQTDGHRSLDDIVIVTETFEQHMQLLQEVANRLRTANLSINLNKSRFEIPFLGCLLSSDGLRANPDKIRPIVEYERPNSITKLRRFLGMANYYRRFIQDFSGATATLSNLP